MRPDNGCSRLKSTSSTSMYIMRLQFVFFFFHDHPTTEIYTLSLHDALPISGRHLLGICHRRFTKPKVFADLRARSEEHTSELQSRVDLVCRLLLEKKK